MEPKPLQEEAGEGGGGVKLWEYLVRERGKHKSKLFDL